MVHQPSGRQPLLRPWTVWRLSPTLARSKAKQMAVEPKAGSVRQTAMLLVGRPFPVPPMHRPRPEHLAARKAIIPPAPRVTSGGISQASYENDKAEQADKATARPDGATSR
jgi:hypothetical protein